MYAVIFTSQLSDRQDGYEDEAARMVERSRTMRGFLGIRSARDADGSGITVCLWDSLEAIAAWRDDDEHRRAQRRGADEWYDDYRLLVCRVLDDRSGPVP
jgi:heme-degrading monooxygenase HmoA